MVTREREIMEFIEEYDVKFIRLAFGFVRQTKTSPSCRRSWNRCLPMA